MVGSAEGRPQVYVGRQPIFNHDLVVVGYELLFRDGVADRADIDDHEGATASVLSGLVETMPARLTVLEILEGQVVDEQTDRGSDGVADIVKLDIQALGRKGVADHVRGSRPTR